MKRKEFIKRASKEDKWLFPFLMMIETFHMYSSVKGSLKITTSDENEPTETTSETNEKHS